MSQASCEHRDQIMHAAERIVSVNVVDLHRATGLSMAEVRYLVRAMQFGSTWGTLTLKVHTLHWKSAHSGRMK